MRKKLIFFLLLIAFIGCESDDSLQPKYFDKIVNKNWIADRISFESYTFYEDNSYTKIREISVVDTSTLEMTSIYDTVNSFWNLKDNIIIFSNSPNIESIEPTDWHIIQLNDTLLEVKYISDMENPYIHSNKYISK